jgi:hypothetical protein
MWTSFLQIQIHLFLEYLGGNRKLYTKILAHSPFASQLTSGILCGKNIKTEELFHRLCV